MARKKIVSDTAAKNKKPIQKLYNKSDVPDNILIKRNETLNQCMAIEKRLPYFLTDYFLYLKNAIAINSRLAYLSDLQFFCQYLIEHHPKFEHYEEMAQIEADAFYQLTAKDINIFLGDYCTRYIVETENADYIIENNTRALARKRSSLSVLFKFLYRNELLTTNITEGFNPIKMPKPQPDAIKRLEIEEVAMMLKAVETGEKLTDKEKQYWEKTKRRDKAILILFTTYGLRVSELQQLNISSFNYARGEFRIFRKRGKETTMPLNQSAIKVIDEYIHLERSAPQNNDDALFLSLQGKRMTVRAIRDLVKKYTSIAMQVPRDKGYSPHKLRATAASSLIQYGFSIYDVQNLLDHENVTTTQLYSAHRRNAKRDVINQYELLDEFNDENNSEEDDR
ncbi:tyrosine-type recombinase/integrase [Fusibacter paucivorans]|uniref:Tyrosine-type recombinase/integrase n=1 Tax=Fusibacter paucivorans TaxID=76009 RepID=A0ABS5PS53_9FIRM|nr:tyrosine-type recombinase/integrase [Fusibacter paucivorans]MBS7527983.1 tyrosine-type recombinase/integrase [Fusibacter paucivorans]